MFSREGWDTFREIFSLYPGQKAGMVSGFSEPKRIEEVRRLGCSGYVKNAYLIETLVRAAWSALNQGVEEGGMT